MDALDDVVFAQVRFNVFRPNRWVTVAAGASEDVVRSASAGLYGAVVSPMGDTPYRVRVHAPESSGERAQAMADIAVTSGLGQGPDRGLSPARVTAAPRGAARPRRRQDPREGAEQHRAAGDRGHDRPAEAGEVGAGRKRVAQREHEREEAREVQPPPAALADEPCGTETMPPGRARASRPDAGGDGGRTPRGGEGHERRGRGEVQRRVGKQRRRRGGRPARARSTPACGAIPAGGRGTGARRCACSSPSPSQTDRVRTPKATSPAARASSQATGRPARTVMPGSRAGARGSGPCRSPPTRNGGPSCGTTTAASHGRAAT